MTARVRSMAPWIRMTGAVMALALGLNARLLAQAATVDELSTRLDPQTAAAVRTLVDAAVLEGIPGEALVSKALEGQMKGASGERIVLAVRNLTSDLAAARRALGPTAAGAEITAGAGALRAGTQPEVLTRLKALRGERSVLLPLAALTDLVARGVSVNDAAETVLSLARRGAVEADYRAQSVIGRVGEGPGGATAGTTAPAIPRPVPVIPAPGAPPSAEPSRRGAP